MTTCQVNLGMYDVSTFNKSGGLKPEGHSKKFALNVHFSKNYSTGQKFTLPCMCIVNTGRN